MKYSFFLGGYDLEMQIIRDLLMTRYQEFFDKQLEWGAKASAYTKEISEVMMEGKVPVLIELELDTELPSSVIVIDHHGNRSGEEASLLQVIRLLGLTPTRDQLLVAANDSGYIPAMFRLGATEKEVSRIRSWDREAQGVTGLMEHQAEKAISKAENRNGVVVVRLPHTKSSTVTDRLFSSWPGGRENLLVVGKIDNEMSEVDYFGRGDVCQAMKEVFSGWGGGQGFGDPHRNGFAGCKTNDPDAVIEFVIQRQLD